MTDLTGRELGDAVAEALGWPRTNLPAPYLWSTPSGEFVGTGNSILTWEGAGLIVEALRERGYDIEQAIASKGVTIVRVGHFDDIGEGNMVTVAIGADRHPPTALAQATVDALGGAK